MFYYNLYTIENTQNILFVLLRGTDCAPMIKQHKPSQKRVFFLGNHVPLF